MKRIFYSAGLALLSFQLSAQVVNNTTLFISENAVVSFGSEVENKGDLINNGKIHFQGSVKNNGTIESQGSVVFDGLTKQTVSGTKSVKLNNLQLDNDVELKTSLTIENELKFNSGILNSEENSPLIFGSNANHKGASDYSHVNGSVLKENTSSFVFPVGSGSIYKSFEVNNGKGQNLTAKYIENNPLNVSSELDYSTDYINESEYWSLKSNSDKNSAKITLNTQDDIAYLKKGAWKVEDKASELNNNILFTAGRGKNIEKGIGIWPNPTTGVFNLKLLGMRDSDNITVDITNHDGRQVMKLNGTVKELRKAYTLPQNMVTSELTVRVINGEDVMTSKLVLNR
jgi:hypothetical protein